MALDTINTMADFRKIVVTGLSPIFNESSVLSEFKKFGEINYIRLKKFKINSSALICFSLANSGEKARSEMNGKLLQNYRINVCTADSFPLKDYNSNIFIKNLAVSIDTSQLEEVFKWYGRIINSKVCYDDNNVSRGYGFIMYQSHDEAKAAIEKANGLVIAGCKVFVSLFVPKLYREPSFNNVYVRGFGNNFKQQDLLNIFSRYGKVVSAIINYKPSESFGFVCFDEASSAEKAVSELHGKMSVFGFEWFVSKNLSKSNRLIESQIKSKINHKKWMKTNLYIKNWPKDLNEENLISVFSKYGKIESVKILIQECLTIESNYPITELKPTGQAFISFADEKSVELALYHMKHTLINNSSLSIHRWVPKNVLYKNSKKKQGYRKSKFLSKMAGNNFKTFESEFNIAVEPVSFFNFEVYYTSRPEDRKRLFGEAIYQEILPKYEKWTGKITGMIIELDEHELISMMENRKLLYLKAKEAMNILNQ
jgi:polyadenylate-binding protein